MDAKKQRRLDAVPEPLARDLDQMTERCAHATGTYSLPH